MSESFFELFFWQVGANAAGTILGGVVLTLLAFFLGDRLFGIPQVYGSWFVVTETQRAVRNDYVGMVVAYRFILNQSGSVVTGTGEKLWDISSRGVVTNYEYKNRVQVEISGSIRRRYLSKSQIILHVSEDGRIRKTAMIYVMKCMHDKSLSGKFDWTASDSRGKVVFNRLSSVKPSDRLEIRRCMIMSIHGVFGRVVYVLGKVLELMNAFYVRDKADKLFLSIQAVKHLDVPKRVCDMLVSAEDVRFYYHRGVDLRAVMRAVWSIIFRRRWQGGSTIEQQCVRVLTQEYENTISRKLREMYLAVLLYRAVPKYRIACIYLSIAYFGYGMQGIRAACRQMGTSIEALSDSAAADLMARIKYPQPKRSTDTWEEKVRRRSNHILEEFNRHFSE